MTPGPCHGGPVGVSLGRDQCHTPRDLGPVFRVSRPPFPTGPGGRSTLTQGREPSATWSEPRIIHPVPRPVCSGSRSVTTMDQGSLPFLTSLTRRPGRRFPVGVAARTGRGTPGTEKELLPVLPGSRTPARVSTPVRRHRPRRAARGPFSVPVPAPRPVTAEKRLPSRRGAKRQGPDSWVSGSIVETGQCRRRLSSPAGPRPPLSGSWPRALVFPSTRVFLGALLQVNLFI